MTEYVKVDYPSFQSLPEDQKAKAVESILNHLGLILERSKYSEELGGHTEIQAVFHREWMKTL